MYVSQPSSSDANATLFGQNALQYLCDRHLALEVECTSQDLKQINSYSWMLEPQQMTALEAKKEKLLQSHGLVVGDVGGNKVAKPKKEKKDKKDKKKKSNGSKEYLDQLFT